ncbi:MAG: hypothetical protein J7507_07105 [Pseudoxanthomonas sp.]|nr:hypothetical protein [Pseudoxanthomonas sp.]
MVRAPSPIRPRLRVALAVAVLAAAPALVASPTQDTPGAAAHGDAAQASRHAHATGDAWLDRQLADIDDYAVRYPEAFAAELERYAGVPRAYVVGLLAQPGWSGGDAWFACFLARAVEATCRAVVRSRTRAGVEADWKEIAAGFGARPGSDAYTAVRLALADSYRRWGRPLQPDAALSRALRQREQREQQQP